MYVSGIYYVCLACCIVYVCRCVRVCVSVCNDNYEKNSNLKLKPKFATKAHVGQQTTSDSSIPTVLPSCQKNYDSIPAPAHLAAPTTRVDDKVKCLEGVPAGVANLAIFPLSLLCCN